MCITVAELNLNTDNNLSSCFLRGIACKVCTLCVAVFAGSGITQPAPEVIKSTNDLIVRCQVYGKSAPVAEMYQKNLTGLPD